MKEVTRIFNVQVTQISKVEDTVAEDIAENAKNGKSKRLLDSWISERLECDDAKASDIKVFIADMEESNG